MAFIIRKRLQPSPSEVALPASITFTATLRDDEASDPPDSAEFLLRLAETNDLSFGPPKANGELVKEKSFKKSVPLNDRAFSFPATIHGEGQGLLSFRVTLVLPDGQESGCLVNLK